MLSFHSSLVSERMSGDREAISDRSLSVCLDVGDDGVYLSGYAPSTKYEANPRERELSADFSKEEEGEEEVEEEEKEEERDEVEEGEGEEEEDEGGEEVEEGRRGEEVEAPISLGDDYRPFILSSIWLVNNFLLKISD